MSLARSTLAGSEHAAPLKLQVDMSWRRSLEWISSSIFNHAHPLLKNIVVPQVCVRMDAKSPAKAPPLFSESEDSAALAEKQGEKVTSESKVGGEFGSFQFVGSDAWRAIDDGRVNIKIHEVNELLAHQIDQLQVSREDENQIVPPYTPNDLLQSSSDPSQAPPPLNIVIQVVGSRGDVQPFVALGLVLKNKYRHRIRLATHGTFKKFVEENGLEHFDIGGDPAELMAFMVKNPGLIPGMKSLREGDVGKRRKGMAEIMQGCWRSCADVEEAKVEDETPGTVKKKPFVAHAIIANPPSFAHIHCAEKLGIPLHLMFTYVSTGKSVSQLWSDSSIACHGLQRESFRNR
jgi:hypothetical protein